MSTCYMCSRPATSREHVPPKCLFPTLEDMGTGPDLRQNLLTVPACAEHNQQKSGDDEYLMYLLAFSMTSNAVARRQVETKVIRSFVRRPALMLRLLDERKPVFIREDGRALEETVAVKPDHRRLRRSVEMIARALFFHHHQRRAPAGARVILHFMPALEGEGAVAFNETLRAVDAQIQRLFQGSEHHGANPTAFSYSTVQSRTQTAFRLTFYEATHATVVFYPLAPFRKSLHGQRG